MPIREQCFGGEGDFMVRFLDNPDVKKNWGRTRGLWTFFVEGEARDELLESLKREVEAGRLANVVVGESSGAADISQKFLLAEEEGFLTRRQFNKRLHDFELLGFEGAWIYFDVGTDRDKHPRRMLCAKSPRAAATEIDYRGRGEPLVKEVSFRPPKSRDRWLSDEI